MVIPFHKQTSELVLPDEMYKFSSKGGFWKIFADMRKRDEKGETSILYLDAVE